MPSEIDETITLPVHRQDAAKCAAQHFGAWAVEPKWFAAAMDSIRTGTLRPTQGPFDDDDDSDAPVYQVVDGIAVISIDGQMTKRGSSFGGASSVQLRQSVRQATSDRAIQGIMLKVCSPGGTVAGTSDLADDVAAAADVKPVWGYAEDLCCSAAYFVASQCGQLYAGTTALIGSIGTMVLLRDATGMQEQIGVKPIVVSTGPFKGLGADGRVSDQLVSDTQREVQELNAPFVAAVTRGRGDRIPDMDAVTDGRVHAAAQAKQLGLVDQVAPFDAAMAALKKEIGIMTDQEFAAYVKANPTAVQSFRDEGHAAGKTAGHADGVATERKRFQGLHEKYGKQRPAFVCEQFAKGHDAGQAAVELSDVLMAENEQLQQKLASGVQAAPAGPAAQVPAAAVGATAHQPIATALAGVDAPPAPANSTTALAAEGRAIGDAHVAQMKRQRGLN